ncbi:MAG: DUF4332 domain-containing protein [Candidatus Bathyarchaeum tardum]|nr:MAG: DUF4332 domain-containing protein [Candidatus Bathyarchaeum tardum]
MVAETLPCAEKKCASKMSLVEDKDNFLYYRCLAKHNEHYFCYNVAQKQWERLIVTRKLVLRYAENPCGEAPAEPQSESAENNKFELDQSVVQEFEKSLVGPVEVPAEESVDENTEASLELPAEAPAKVSDAEEILDDIGQNLEIVSDLMKIKGIGSSRAQDLVEAGVYTISDLAKCSASDLSKETGLPVSKLVTWIVKAKTLVDDEVIISA